MAPPRRLSEAALRSAARRERENSAPRLHTQLPRLESLSLEIDQRRVGSAQPAVAHIRRVVVENAPALFLVPCCDRDCKDGGYDLTHEILSALASGRARFDGAQQCQGSLGSAPCGHMLHYVAQATYRATAQPMPS